MAEYTLTPTQSEQARTAAEVRSEDDICGAELSRGGVCERPADECPYHGSEEN